MTKEKTRAAFEAEWIRRMGNSFLQKDEGGEYTSDCTYDNHIWFTRGYQASAAETEALIEELVGALDKLARLGNGYEYGNSDGNIIAQQAARIERYERALNQVDDFFTALGKYTRDYPGGLYTHVMVKEALKNKV